MDKFRKANACGNDIDVDNLAKAKDASLPEGSDVAIYSAPTRSRELDDNDESLMDDILAST